MVGSATKKFSVKKWREWGVDTEWFDSESGGVDSAFYTKRSSRP
jgi:hypothetical protein